MTTLTSIIAPTNILTPSSSATVTNKTISGANNTLTVCLANDVSGALPVANGGFGQSSYTDGQLLIGNTAGSLSKTTLTAGTNIAITNSGGSISIAYCEPIVYINSAWMWGQNSFFGSPRGNLGDNTIVDKSSPVSVVGGFTDWCQISAGRTSAAAIRTNGTLWAWGVGDNGALGDNTTVSKSSPVSVVGGFTDWCQVSAGRYGGHAVRTNGTLWGWGAGSYGQLGDNTTVSKSSPVSVVGGFTNWCQVSAPGGATYTTLAVRTNGTLWAWGSGECGQLGDGTTVNKSSPISVIGGFTDWSQVSGAYQSLALRQNGTIWAWGRNGTGALGDNTTSEKSSPVSVIGGFTDWCQVSAGTQQSVAVRTNGSVWSWGQNCFGQLGTNSTTNTSSPVSVVGGFTDWCQVSSGAQQSIGLRTNGTAWSWGRGIYGGLGDNSTANKSSPVSIAGGFTDWVCLSYPHSGSRNSGAIRSTAT